MHFFQRSVDRKPALFEKSQLATQPSTTKKEKNALFFSANVCTIFPPFCVENRQAPSSAPQILRDFYGLN